MADLILHHYPQSPFSEKVRAVLGYKKLAWRSVIIPRVMPKPDLMPLTGGYRRTPVMQIGADIYVDTQAILREIERRHPDPTLYPPGTEGVADALAFWADRSLFWAAAGVVFPHRLRIGGFPPTFLADRSVFTGRDLTPEALSAAEPFQLDQVRAFLTWVDRTLADGRPFLFGAAASVADFAVYNPVWFLRQHMGADALPLSGFAQIPAWEARIQAFGQGTPTELSSADALRIAREAEPQTSPRIDQGDPGGRLPGLRVSVMPDDTGRDPVTGVLVSSGPHSIVISREDPAVGEVRVHFPRAGFVLNTLQA